MKLETVDEFLNYLNPNRKDLKRSQMAMESLSLDIKDLREYIFWDQQKYTRNLITKTEVFEVFICCWEPGQMSHFHDLNGQLGWVKVMQGNITARVTDRKDFVETNNYTCQSLQCNDLFMHQSRDQLYSLVNDSDQRTITIHMVSLPVSFHNVIQGMGNDVEQISVMYHSINGKKIA